MSTLKADTIQSTGGGAATLTKQSAPKAYAYWNQETPAIVDSLNASSITDSATGIGGISWSSALSSASYMCTTGAPTVAATTVYTASALDDGVYGYVTKTTTFWSFNTQYVRSDTNTAYDARGSICAAMGDLA